ncbi:MAG: hypothetical protein IKB86_07135 [Clostridia bacterium]|nr:hypothetical protein [Clostridia bacterium]
MEKITFGNKTIISTDFSDFETAWKIDDSLLVLEYLKSKNKIVLGGDILTEKLEHNYDNWYYDTDSNQNHKTNVEQGFKTAYEYISNYIKLNGTTFFVVIVTKEL